MSENIEERLMVIAAKRMEQFNPENGIPADVVYRMLGITPEEISGGGDVEIE